MTILCIAESELKVLGIRVPSTQAEYYLLALLGNQRSACSLISALLEPNLIPI